MAIGCYFRFECVQVLHYTWYLNESIQQPGSPGLPLKTMEVVVRGMGRLGAISGRWHGDASMRPEIRKCHAWHGLENLTANCSFCWWRNEEGGSGVFLVAGLAPRRCRPGLYVNNAASDRYTIEAKTRTWIPAFLQVCGAVQIGALLNSQRSGA